MKLSTLGRRLRLKSSTLVSLAQEPIFISNSSCPWTFICS